MRWILVEARDRVMPEISADARARSPTRELRGRGIEIRTNTTLERGHRATAPTLSRRRGRADAHASSGPPACKPQPGRRRARPAARPSAGGSSSTARCASQGRENVWAIGDAAAVPDPARTGQPSPPTAQHAIRQGRARGAQRRRRARRRAACGRSATRRSACSSTWAATRRSPRRSASSGAACPAWFLARTYHLAHDAGHRAASCACSSTGTSACCSAATPPSSAASRRSSRARSRPRTMAQVPTRPPRTSLAGRADAALRRCARLVAIASGRTCRGARSLRRVRGAAAAAATRAATIRSSSCSSARMTPTPSSAGAWWCAGLSRRAGRRSASAATARSRRTSSAAASCSSTAACARQTFDDEPFTFIPVDRDVRAQVGDVIPSGTKWLEIDQDRVAKEAGAGGPARAAEPDAERDARAAAELGTEGAAGRQRARAGRGDEALPRHPGAADARRGHRQARRPLARLCAAGPDGLDADGPVDRQGRPHPPAADPPQGRRPVDGHHLDGDRLRPRPARRRPARPTVYDATNDVAAADRRHRDDGDEACGTKGASKV